MRILKRNLLGTNTILNINIPDLPRERIKGVRATHLEHCHKAEPVSRIRDLRGDTLYRVGPPGPERNAGPGTDFHALRNGYVSVSPLPVDSTRHAALEPPARRLSGYD